MTPQAAAGIRPELKAAALLRLACAYAVATNGTILMPLIVAVLMRRFGVGEDTATGMAGLEIVGVAIACAVLPHRVARAPRAFAWLGAIGTVAAQAAGAWLPGVGWVGVSRGVAGLFEGMLFAVVAASLSRRAAAERAWGIVILGAGIFDGALLVGAAFLPERWADAWLFPAFAASFALIAGPTAGAGAYAAPSGSASASAPRGQRLPWGVLLPIWAAMVLVYGVLSAQWAVAAVVGQRAGITPSRSGLLLSLASVLGLAGCLAASHRRSHELRRPIIAGAQLAMAASVVWFCAAQGWAGYFVSQLLITLAFYALTPFLTARLSSLDADGSLVARSVVISFASVAFATAAAGTLLAGLGGLGLGLALAACAVVSMPFARRAFAPLPSRLEPPTQQGTPP